MSLTTSQRTRAQESRAAIERLYIAMRHLFIRGSYKPLGISGEAMIHSLKTLNPEIYGSINDPERVELDGLLYIFQRLPKGIEECRFVRMISREGLQHSGLPCIVPSKRRRNAYRIDNKEMYIELTRGRSDIYDILTHLTFMYIEAEKIRTNSQTHKGGKKREWEKLEIIVEREKKGEEFNKEIAFTYLTTLLGRTYSEVKSAYERFEEDEEVNSLFHITYWLGRLSFEEYLDKTDREISFSPMLRERIGHHHYGERWANNIKKYLFENNLFDRPIHVISANLHSVMNTLYARAALGNRFEGEEVEDIAREISMEKNSSLRKKINAYALKHGMHVIDHTSGTNITVQIFDTTKINVDLFPEEILMDKSSVENNKPVIIVMDYAFGEQAYETMDELLKPYKLGEERHSINVKSISIMGKAGILAGDKGDIMVPTAHIFEGTADNYPFENDFCKEDFENKGIPVYEGPMITVLGTSLQNKDILRYFFKSSWKSIGLEMEGAHYQKAIQAASKIRKVVNDKITLRYAYYASDNPLITGSTLASGGLGVDGVKPTYLITTKILSRIMGGHGPCE